MILRAGRIRGKMRAARGYLNEKEAGEGSQGKEAGPKEPEQGARLFPFDRAGGF